MLISDGSAISNERVAGIAAAVSERLAGDGIEPGERILLVARNSPDFVVGFFALVDLNISIVIVDAHQTRGELERMAAVSGTSIALTDDPALPPAGMRTIELGPLVAAVNDPPARPLDLSAWTGRRDALIAWSSGSTGHPKGIVRSGRSIVANTERTCARMAYTQEDVLLPLLPFSHQYGISLVLTWLMSDCSLLITPYGRLDRALRAGAAAGATSVDATPSTYHTILNLGERRPELLADLSRVRMWCVGGAPLDPTLSDRFLTEVGQPLLDGYGSTEAGNIALATPDNPNGCGRPLPGVGVSIVDDDGKELGTGQTGEVVVRSADLMEGYLPLEEPAAPLTELRTNDLGYFDAEGNLYVVGRKFAVHRLGHTIYPEAVERRAAAALGRPVAVVPVEDERLGCRLVFFVADAGEPQPADWRARLTAQLPAHEGPNQVVVLDRIPVTARGKPDMAALRRLAKGGVRTNSATPAMEPPEERVRGLRAVEEMLRDDPQPVIDILTEISLHRSVMAEIDAARATLAGAVEEVLTHGPARVRRLAAFMPSNVLLYSYVLYLLVPALFTERLTARPASVVADQLHRLHALLAPVHNLPIEVVAASQREFVTGQVASADVVIFTGAYSNAEQVRATLRDEQLFVFFGQGVNPFIVGPDAQVGRAVRDAMRVRLLNSGQDCYGPDVLYVHDSVKDAFVDGLTRAVAAARYGGNRDPEADYGSLWYDTAVEGSADYLRRNHEHIVAGGAIDFRTRRVEPTVLVRDWAPRVPIVEFFAPIFNVVGYSTAQQVSRHIDSPFFAERAMGAMVYDAEPGLVDTLRKRHTVAVNSTLIDVDDGNQPFGGHGVMAGYVMRHGKRWTGPTLLSQVVAEHLTKPRPV
ncbi:aldehyde dehydrogenase family protein [Nonomuraea sp. NPDC050790]|uniref:aldehyde dehydrogenase family protein n=1 Tax=Nonomuraea sp. NPDC050790 TaxID=3364371 RepID=UPI0037BB2B2C